ncbi:MAG: spondin domain-containing protein, partial [Nitrosopumilus sp.]|nr:spondin domain-containing protein [Nitrosopumilus sp.]
MKSKKTGILAFTSIVALLTVVSLTGIPESDAAQAKMYEVTVTNLTPGQPLTPPLLVTHEHDAGFFSAGEMASEELRQLAENGNLDPLVAMLQS